MKLWITKLKTGCVITPDDDKSQAEFMSDDEARYRVIKAFEAMGSGEAMSIYTHSAKEK